MDIVMRVDSDSQVFLGELLDNKDISVDPFSSKGFDGSSVVSIVVALTPLAVPIIGKIIIELIRARKYVEIVANGVKVKGLDAENAIKVIEALHETSAGRGGGSKKK